MKKCQICGKETKDNIVWKSPDVPEGLNVCADCLNLIHNQEWDKLTKIIQKITKNKNINVGGLNGD